MKFPSLKNENPRTWKCKIFGCNDEELPLIWQEPGEKHGIKGWSFATATRTLTTYIVRGCKWCRNYRTIFGDVDEIWPKWLCDCEICEKSRVNDTSTHS